MFGCFAWLKKTGCNNEGDLITEIFLPGNWAFWIWQVQSIRLPTLFFLEQTLVNLNILYTLEKSINLLKALTITTLWQEISNITEHLSVFWCKKLHACYPGISTKMYESKNISVVVEVVQVNHCITVGNQFYGFRLFCQLPKHCSLWNFFNFHHIWCKQEFNKIRLECI